MGNCQGRISTTVWAGDDWENITDKEQKDENENLLAETNTLLSRSSSRREVKITITKKQLEELLGKVEVHNTPVDEVLSSLIDACAHFEIQHQQSWRPSLKSIPEFEW